jgi:hypothetical protein
MAAEPSVTVVLGRWDIRKSTSTWTNPDLDHAVIAGFDMNKPHITINRIVYFIS